MYSMGTRRFALEHIKVTHHISIYFCILSLISQSLHCSCGAWRQHDIAPTTNKQERKVYRGMSGDKGCKEMRARVIRLKY